MIGLTKQSRIAPEMQHMLHFVTASFDWIGLVRIASTQCAGEH